jgi:hypothetical protein
MLHEAEHDTYMPRHSLPEPTGCPDCGAIYHRGRWQWGPIPAGAHRELCPACQRIRDKYPAATVTITGPFALQHASEISSLARNEEIAAKAEHPLERIIEIDIGTEVLTMTTTNAHLARRIGKALRRAYGGELHLYFVEDTDFLRVQWTC